MTIPNALYEFVAGQYGNATGPQLFKKVSRMKEESVANPVVGIGIMVVAAVMFAVGYSFTPGIVMSAIVGIFGLIVAVTTKKIKRSFYDVEIPIETPPVERTHRIVSMGRVALPFYTIKKDGATLVFRGDAAGIEWPTVEDPEALEKSLAELQQGLNAIPYVTLGEPFVCEDGPDLFDAKLTFRGFDKDLVDWLNAVKQELSRISYQNIGVAFSKDTRVLIDLIKREAGIPTTLSDVIYFAKSDLASRLLKWGDVESQLHALDVIRAGVGPNLKDHFIGGNNFMQNLAFNFYCPHCNDAVTSGILNETYSVHSQSAGTRRSFSRNTRCQFDAIDNMWKCPVCEKKIVMPIPMHKALDELLLPVMEKLLEEHQVEREKRYSETRSREMEYRRALKTRMDEVNYNNINDILRLEDEMDKIRVEISGLNEAIEKQREMARHYKQITSEMMDKIQYQTRQSIERVNKRQQEVAQHMDNFTTKLLESFRDDMDHLSKAARMDEQRLEMIQRQQLQAMNIGNMLKVAHMEQDRQHHAEDLAVQFAISKGVGNDVNKPGLFRLDRHLARAANNFTGMLTGRSEFENELNLLRNN
jgi:hypothetical protein